MFADMIEARPLVRAWQPVTSAWLPKTAKAFQRGNTIALVTGMGAKHAAATARAVVEEFSPVLVVSAGFAGAIDERLEPAVVLHPTRVVNAMTGHIHAIDAQAQVQVTLVSAEHVVNQQEKRELGRRYAAVAVDMEGAAVAEVARAAGIEFRVRKVISERADFPMPPFDRFIGENGRLRTVSFLMWVAMRPRYWVPLIQLARDSAAAAEELASDLDEEFCLN